jgi:hypothetical protein
MLHRSPVRRLVGAALLGLSLAPGLASAHYPWMTPADYGPPAGEALEFSIHSGHAFPDGDSLGADRLAGAQLLGADGLVLDLELGAGSVFRTPPLPVGESWVLAARQAPGFYSRTPRGGQRSSRTDNPDALSCGYWSNVVKALVGDGAVTTVPVAGHPLEILPLAAGAAAGETLAVRVLLHGRPWQGQVQAVYAGFEGQEGEYPVNVGTDPEGIAAVPLDRAGRWLLKASANEPYRDPSVCDQSHYHATLTLMVR